MLKRIIALSIACVFMVMCFSALGENFGDSVIDAERDYTAMVECFADCDFGYAIEYYETCDLEGYKDADFLYYMAKAFDVLLDNVFRAKQGQLDTDYILVNLRFAERALKDGDSIQFSDRRSERETDYWGTIEYPLAALVAYVEARGFEQMGDNETSNGSSAAAAQYYSAAAEKYLESKLFDFLKRASEIEGRRPEAIPERLKLVNAASSDAYSISIKLEDSDRTDETVYSVLYGPVDGGAQEQLFNDTCEFEITGLIPSTKYNLLISADGAKFTLTVETKDAPFLTEPIMFGGDIELQQVAITDLERGEQSAYNRGKFARTVLDEDTGTYIIALRKRMPTGSYRYYLVTQTKKTNENVDEYEEMLVLRLEGAGTYSWTEKYPASELSTSYVTLHHNTDKLFEDMFSQCNDEVRNALILSGDIEMYINGMFAGSIPVTMIRK